MMIDTTMREQSLPHYQPSDNQALRQRLHGRSVADRTMQELHAVARERILEPEVRGRARRFKRR